jgi:hypothetical protein
MMGNGRGDLFPYLGEHTMEGAWRLGVRHESTTTLSLEETSFEQPFRYRLPLYNYSVSEPCIRSHVLILLEHIAVVQGIFVRIE